MALGREEHSVALADRGGTRMLGFLDNISRVKWNRIRDDISEAEVIIERPSDECIEILREIGTNRTEMVIFRGGTRAWEGPITLDRRTRDRVVLQAKDVMHHVYRTVMKNGYSNAHPNTSTVVQRVAHIITEEMARKEALVPPHNILPHLTVIEGDEGARTAAVTKPFEMTLFNHIDNLAARAGLEYTTVGRRIILFDGSALIGQTPPVTQDDIFGELIVTEYGMEAGTYAVVTDGEGQAGEVGGHDGYYGLIELLDNAYGEEAPDDDPPDVNISELRSQARRNLAGRNPAPITVRMPDGTTLNPEGVFEMEHLVPGVWVPLYAKVPGREIAQMMRLDEVRFEYTPQGESVAITLSPRPSAGGGTDIVEEE